MACRPRPAPPCSGPPGRITHILPPLAHLPLSAPPQLARVRHRLCAEAPALPRLPSIRRDHGALPPCGWWRAAPHQAHRRAHLPRRERPPRARRTNLQPALPAKHHCCIPSSKHRASAPRPASAHQCPGRHPGWLAGAVRLALSLGVGITGRERAAVARARRPVRRRLRRSAAATVLPGAHCRTARPLQDPSAPSTAGPSYDPRGSTRLGPPQPSTSLSPRPRPVVAL
jgi:hypothetical protein